jgi:hypothetical protein
VAANGHLAPHLLTASIIRQQLAERAQRIREDRALGPSLDLHLHLDSVLYPPIAHLGRLTITSSPCRWRSIPKACQRRLDVTSGHGDLRCGSLRMTCQPAAVDSG